MSKNKLKRILHLATSIALVPLGTLGFFLTQPPNATLLLPVFYGMVFLIAFPIWSRDLKYTALTIAFLYLTLLLGIMDPLEWSFNNEKWIVFGICLVIVIAIALNLWQQIPFVFQKWKSYKENRKNKTEIRTSPEQHS
ncbi:MAG: hypothetical protein R2879_17300 [Saprospiraceae bacterium]